MKKIHDLDLSLLEKRKDLKSIVLKLLQFKKQLVEKIELIQINVHDLQIYWYYFATKIFIQVTTFFVAAEKRSS